ncbi:hypothetical protein CRE_14889 [Caenorhabditis remanei]|uniref:Uncharacterized protein n=1 Tax=Caenorhabditis remanei TaxID=31234 RepID=E3N1X4_CAERE|nr:hypothetical protein CRE_14889 [Caenorhabditis remanei]
MSEISENYRNTDLEIPQYLIHHYLTSGSISILMNSFVCYLLIFRKGRLDTFRFYLLAFQVSSSIIIYFQLNFQIICFICDFHLSFLMQLVPFFPYVIGGFAVGLLPTFSILSPHYCMTILSFLVGCQVNMLTICFLRKHQIISNISGKYKLSTKAHNFIAMLCLLIPITYSIPFHLTGKTRNEQFKIIEMNYPLFHEKFLQLTNFAIYEFDTMMKTFATIVLIGCVQSVNTVFLLTFQMYKALVICSSSLSKETLEKHKSSLRSLIGQFLVTPIAVLPAMLIVSTIVFPFDGAQVFTWFMLIIMTTHSTINCLVVIFTIPKFRKIILFWTKEGRKLRRIRMESRTMSFMGNRMTRNSFRNSMS